MPASQQGTGLGHGTADGASPRGRTFRFHGGRVRLAGQALASPAHRRSSWCRGGRAGNRQGRGGFGAELGAPRAPTPGPLLRSRLPESRGQHVQLDGPRLPPNSTLRSAPEGTLWPRASQGLFSNRAGTSAAPGAGLGWGDGAGGAELGNLPCNLQGRDLQAAAPSLRSGRDLRSPPLRSPRLGQAASEGLY